MSAGRGEQIERALTQYLWGKKTIRTSGRWKKKVKLRRERRRSKMDPECNPEYRRYCGWEW